VREEGRSVKVKTKLLLSFALAGAAALAAGAAGVWPLWQLTQGLA
jgi:hypothetical protein